LSKNYDHHLAIAGIYFGMLPDHFLFEPQEDFKHVGADYVWNPDCIFVHQKKVYVAEIQLTPISSARWKKKWNIFNLYFDNKYFHNAQFQKWANGKIILPQFLCFTNQNPEIVKQGFEVSGRDLILSGLN
jgi:hypothetical protein